MKSSDYFQKFLDFYLQKDEDAKSWCLGFTTYCHLVDDLCDNGVGDKQFIVKSFDFATILYSHPFYQRNCHILSPIIRAGSNDYADSLAFEGATEEWKRIMADTLRQNINSVILAVIEIVSGYDVKRQASLELREISYKTHHDEVGQPI